MTNTEFLSLLRTARTSSGLTTWEWTRALAGNECTDGRDRALTALDNTIYRHANRQCQNTLSVDDKRVRADVLREAIQPQIDAAIAAAKNTEAAHWAQVRGW